MLFLDGADQTSKRLSPDVWQPSCRFLFPDPRGLLRLELSSFVFLGWFLLGGIVVPFSSEDVSGTFIRIAADTWSWSGESAPTSLGKAAHPYFGQI